MKTWEDYITLNSADEPSFEALVPAKLHYDNDSRKEYWKDLDFKSALEKDDTPLPLTKDREGYYGDDHFSYWASGYRDAQMLLGAANEHQLNVKSFLDIGCASGRVIRHFGLQHPEVKTYGCDLNRNHVEWCNEFLQSSCTVFQNHSIPTIPLPDSSIDMISAFSVFTHIESMETAWLMEIKRILSPGGIAWLTVHTEQTLHEMNENWPLWNPIMSHPKSRTFLDKKRNFNGNRLVFRWSGERSYSSNVFYRKSYIENNWGNLINIVDFRHRCPEFQDVIIVQKEK